MPPKTRKRKRVPSEDNEEKENEALAAFVLSSEDEKVEEKEPVNLSERAYSHGSNAQVWRDTRQQLMLPLIKETRGREDLSEVAKTFAPALEALMRKVTSVAVRELADANFALAGLKPPRAKASKKQLIKELAKIFPSLVQRGLPIEALLPTIEVLRGEKFPDLLVKLSERYPAKAAPLDLPKIPDPELLEMPEQEPLLDQAGEAEAPLELAASLLSEQEQTQLEESRLKLRLLRNKVEMSDETLRKRRLMFQNLSSKNGLHTLKRLVMTRFANPHRAVPVRLETLTRATFNAAVCLQPLGADLFIKPKALDAFFEIPEHPNWIETHGEAVEALEHHEELHEEYIKSLPSQETDAARVMLAGVKRFHRHLLSKNDLVSCTGQMLRTFTPRQIHEIFNLVVMNLGNGQFRTDARGKPPLFEQFEKHGPIQNEVLKIMFRQPVTPAQPPSAPKASATTNKKGGGSKKESGKGKEQSSHSDAAKKPKSRKGYKSAAVLRDELPAPKKARSEAILRFFSASAKPEVQKLCRNFHSLGPAVCGESCPRSHDCPVCPGHVVHSLFETKNDRVSAHKDLALPSV
jgi:hypothetical protein